MNLFFKLILSIGLWLFILLTVTFNLKELMLFKVCLIIHYWLLLIVLEMNFYHCLQKGYSTIFFNNLLLNESAACLDSSPKSTAFLISLGLRARSTSFFLSHIVSFSYIVYQYNFIRLFYSFLPLVMELISTESSFHKHRFIDLFSSCLLFQSIMFSLDKTF